MTRFEIWGCIAIGTVIYYGAKLLLGFVVDINTALDAMWWSGNAFAMHWFSNR